VDCEQPITESREPELNSLTRCSLAVPQIDEGFGVKAANVDSDVLGVAQKFATTYTRSVRSGVDLTPSR
jgi:hypothetical protein